MSWDIRLIHERGLRGLDARTPDEVWTQTDRRPTMLIKTALALAIVLGTAAGAVAAPKRYSTNPAHDVYDTRGNYVGSDPDPTVRAMLLRDVGL
jgi:hypothetical protein